MKNLEEGMVVARPVYDENMRLLVNSGIVLSNSLIENLERRGYKYIYIQEAGTEDIEVEEPVSVDVSRRVVTEIDKTFDKMRNLSKAELSMLKAVSEKLNMQNRFIHLTWRGSFRKNVLGLVKDLFYSKMTTISSFSLSMLGTSALSHAMDTTILSILIGKRFHYELKELVSLATACLLHDCGMQFLPELGGKPYFLYDEEERLVYQKHPRLGYVLLESLDSFTPTETQTILQHHENQDGSGFPSGYKGDNDAPVNKRRGERGRIFRWAEILAVADRYIKYCSGDLTEVPKTPPESIATLIKESKTILNSTIVKEFSSIISVFPKGAVVKVVNARDKSIVGSEGVVCKENLKYMDRPQIILLRSRIKVKMKPTLVDLSNDDSAKLELLFLN